MPYVKEKKGYAPMLRQLPAVLMTSWTRNMDTEPSDGGECSGLAWMQASRYASTILACATELLRRAADARTSDNLAHFADTDFGGAGEGMDDGRVDDAGGSAG